MTMSVHWIMHNNDDDSDDDDMCWMGNLQLVPQVVCS